MPLVRLVKSRVFPAGTATPFIVMVGQLFFAAIADAASVKVQLVARFSIFMSDAGRVKEWAAPALRRRARIDLKRYIVKEIWKGRNQSNE